MLYRDLEEVNNKLFLILRLIYLTELKNNENNFYNKETII